MVLDAAKETIKNKDNKIIYMVKWFKNLYLGLKNIVTKLRIKLNQFKDRVMGNDATLNKR